MTNDPVGDMLARIRNAQQVRKMSVSVPASKLRRSVLEVMKREGYIRGCSEEEVRPGITQIKVELKYREGEPVLQHMQRVSKPGRRVYSSIKDLTLVRNGLGVSVLSTSKGVMSDSEAREANVGGEVLCNIY